MNEHYVYLYADPRNGDVFYVGCGKGRRMWVHLRPSLLSKESKKNHILKGILSAGLHPMIAVVDSGLTQEAALSKEREWIRFYGKENLTNLTTGGQGCSGISPFLGKHHTEEAKEMIRQSKLGKFNPMFGKKRTADALKKFSEKISGKNHPFWGKTRDQKTCDKISETLKRKPMSEEEREIRRQRLDSVRKKMKAEGRDVTRHRQMIVCGDENLSIDDWSVKTGIKKSTIRVRIDRKWTTKQALGMEER
jgi:group I intron endonuclease